MSFMGGQLEHRIFSALCGRKPIYVISHERSGTHLVLNLCYRNLYIRQKFCDLTHFYDTDIRRSIRESYWKEHGVHCRSLQGDGGLIKSHCEAEIWADQLPSFPVVFVLRDPRDTLVSFYHYLNRDEFHRNNPGLSDLRCSSFSEFLRRPLHPFLQCGFSLRDDAANIVDRWARHTQGWLDAQGVLVLRYEKLLRGFYLSMLRTSLHCRVLPKFHMRPYRLGESGAILPRKGVAGDWLTHFSEDDVRFVAARMKGYGLNLTDWN